jgi:hypothetical protein
VITLPTTNQTVEIEAGTILVANDTKEVSELGHDSSWVAGSVAMQLPFGEDVVPKHRVVNEGPCKAN